MIPIGIATKAATDMQRVKVFCLQTYRAEELVNDLNRDFRVLIFLLPFHSESHLFHKINQSRTFICKRNRFLMKIYAFRITRLGQLPNFLPKIYQSMNLP